MTIYEILVHSVVGEVDEFLKPACLGKNEKFV